MDLLNILATKAWLDPAAVVEQNEGLAAVGPPPLLRPPSARPPS